jgi:hypothetical protein
MANENSVSTGWLLLYIVLALLIVYGTVSFVGGL